ncbi:MAG TPA: type IV secretion system protein [Povalibacter sp.]|uniref:type IV secretion system protein n=1 Tax=Povalibacter sp. TaxID=1962978 RepID=UPI002C071C95|nr:type IV secretion system protein [Povalibacter sp.]HMN43828.1 type IV secretion system protein [Povalibacter sp.]
MCQKAVGSVVLALCLLQVAPTASAQFAVVDAAAIVRLTQQIQSMREQLETTRQQLTQARQTYEAMRGGRGMERLLEGTVRNYLPPSWEELESAVVNASVQYQQLANEVRALQQQNAVLGPQALELLSPRDRQELERARQAVAMHQVTARAALTASSQRFESLQRLIDAIPAAGDQKAILDLQARIAAEQGMLVNEQTKLQMLAVAIEAERNARRQRLKEQAIDAFGSLRDLPPIGL